MPMYRSSVSVVLCTLCVCVCVCEHVCSLPSKFSITAMASCQGQHHQGRQASSRPKRTLAEEDRHPDVVVGPLSKESSGRYDVDDLTSNPAVFVVDVDGRPGQALSASSSEDESAGNPSLPVRERLLLLCVCASSCLLVS